MNLNSKIIKKITKIILWTIISFLSILIIVFILLNIPSVQTYIAKRVANYFSEEMQTEIRIDKVKITLKLDISFENLLILDKHKNIMLAVESANCDIDKISILKNKIIINSASLHKSTFNLTKYKNETDLNIKFIIDYFKPQKKTEKKSKWKVSIKHFLLNNANFNYHNNHNLPYHKDNFLDFSHLKISNLNLIFNNINVFGDTIIGNIKNLSFADSSGFLIKNFNANLIFRPQKISLNSLYFETLKSKIHTDIDIKFKQASDFNDILNKIYFDANFYKSEFYTNDVCFLAKKIEKFDNKITFSGIFEGCISNFKTKNFKIHYNKNTVLNGSFNFKGLPDIKTTQLEAKIDYLLTNYYDIVSFNLPQNKKIIIPSKIANLKDIIFVGEFNGYYNKFVSNAKIKTLAGIFNYNLNVAPFRETVKYEGQIESPNFNISYIDTNYNITNISLLSKINGTGLTIKNAIFNLESKFNYIVYKNNKFENINSNIDYKNRTLKGFININDNKINAEISSFLNFNKTLPSIQISGKIENAQLKTINIIKFKNDNLLTTNFEADLNGNNLENLVGYIKLKNIHYKELNESYLLNNFHFNSDFNIKKEHKITVQSDWIDGDISGNFIYSDVASSLKNIIGRFFPSIIKNEPNPKNSKFYVVSKDTLIRNKNLNFNFLVKNSEPISKLFAPQFISYGSSRIVGIVDVKKDFFYINYYSDSTLWRNFLMKEFNATSKTIDSSLFLNLSINNLLVSRKDNINFENIIFKSVVKQEKIKYHLNWKNNKKSIINNNGDIEGEVLLLNQPIIKANINKGTITINDSVWKIHENNNIEYDSNIIKIDNLEISTNSQSIKINGIITDNEEKSLTIGLKNFNISDLDILMKNRSFDLDGYINGKVEIANIFKNISLISNLEVIDFGINDQKIGNALIVSAWDNRKKGLFVNTDVIYKGNIGTSQPIVLQGYIYPQKNEIDFTADLLNFKLKVIEKYLKTIFKSVEGYASGKLFITGSFSKPQLAGKIRLMRSFFGVDYLNTSYTLNQEIEIQNDKIIFNNLKLVDEKNNIAILNGYLKHKNFKDFSVNIQLQTDEFFVLNTNQSLNNQFYGKAFITGACRIYGEAPNIVIESQVETQKNSEIFIPISYTTSVSKSSFISFVDVSKKENKVDLNVLSASQTNQQINKGLSIDLLLKVNEFAKFHIFLDPSTGGSLHGNGNGNLKLFVNTKGEFNIFGTYTISAGEYKMVLKDVIQRNFDIENGGTITWTGDPTDADINIKAYYSTKASLNSLFAIDSSNLNNNYRKIPVYSTLTLTGKLLNPNVKFGIELPNTDNNTKSMFYNVLDTTNDQNMIRQTFSLLVLGRFESNSNIYGNVIGEGVGMSSMDLITNQLNNWASQYIKDVSIGLNYKMADQLTTDELQIALSKDFFNERLTINSNVGVGGQNKNTSTTQQNNNNFVGEATIEYKITPDGRFVAKAYNLTNTDQYTNQNIPYKQGAGFVYRVNYNKFSDLFKRKKKETKVIQNQKKQ